MKYFKLALLILVCCGLSACSYSSNNKDQMPKEMPNDFAFSVRFGVGSKNLIDSFNGVVVKDLISAGIAEAKMTFTQDEMLSIYEQMVKINVLGTKDLINDSGCRVKPHGEDIWQIRIGSEEKTVQWSGEYCEVTGDIKQLKDLRNFVLEIVKNKGEYKKLHEPEGAYL
ncbi:hypothetical protein [Paenibacillus sp. PL91]|uniref:hypothetical protein n=1 Tax=Paenibacillus sp. PL91 TaxID=2729538 RepID=UPI00145DDF79|nr:hypothetical protein [Paenibacillus sp. PL91]MBC9205053.1 hypothetical protein [Paenibacillus sp. PL91]